MKLKLIEIIKSEYGFKERLNKISLIKFINENLTDSQIFGLITKAKYNHSKIMKKFDKIYEKDFIDRNEMIDALSYLFDSTLYKEYFKLENNKQKLNIDNLFK